MAAAGSIRQHSGFGLGGDRVYDPGAGNGNPKPVEANGLEIDVIYRLGV